jgi:hypothetical protein
MAGSADVLAGLRDIRMPAAGGTDILAEVGAAFAIGLLAAILLALLARLVARRPPSLRQAALTDLARTRFLAPDERVFAQARLLQRVSEALGAPGSQWPAELDRRLGTDFFTHGAGRHLHEDLYKPGTALDPDRLDADLVRLLRRIRS